jgi:hypothetical protein
MPSPEFDRCDRYPLGRIVQKLVIVPAPIETLLDILGPIPIKPATTGQAVMQSLTSIDQTLIHR